MANREVVGMQVSSFARVVGAALDNIRQIEHIAQAFCQYEMVQPVAIEMDEVMHLARSAIRHYSRVSQPSKRQYLELIDIYFLIDDCLHEVEMMTGKLIKEANELPPEERRSFYEDLGICEIDKEDQGLSEDRKRMLHGMLALVGKVTDEYYELFGYEHAEVGL